MDRVYCHCQKFIQFYLQRGNKSTFDFKRKRKRERETEGTDRQEGKGEREEIVERLWRDFSVYVSHHLRESPLGEVQGSALKPTGEIHP